MGKITYNLPIFVEIGVRKKKKYYLNLNIYRNQAYHLNNNIKKKMKEIVSEVCPKFYFEKFSLTYIVYFPDNRLRDVNNVCSVVDKYQLDALTELGYIPDDNYKYLENTCFKFGGIDVDNPRMEVIIDEIKE